MRKFEIDVKFYATITIEAEDMFEAVRIAHRTKNSLLEVRQGQVHQGLDTTRVKVSDHLTCVGPDRHDMPWEIN